MSEQKVEQGLSILDAATESVHLDSFPPLPTTESQKKVYAASMGVKKKFDTKGAALSGEYRIYLGQYKISELRGCWRHAVDERGCYYDLSLVVKYPTVEDYLETVRNCAVGCGVVALLAAYATSGAAAAAAKEVFIGCLKACLFAALGDVANQFSLDIAVDFVRCSKWSNH